MTLRMWQKATCDFRGSNLRHSSSLALLPSAVRLWQKPFLPVTWMSGCTAPVPPGGGCSPDPSVPCHCLKGSGPEPPSNTSLRPPGPQTLFLVSAFMVLEGQPWAQQSCLCGEQGRSARLTRGRIPVQHPTRPVETSEMP